MFQSLVFTEYNAAAGLEQVATAVFGLKAPHVEAGRVGAAEHQSQAIGQNRVHRGRRAAGANAEFVERQRQSLHGKALQCRFNARGTVLTIAGADAA